MRSQLSRASLRKLRLQRLRRLARSGRPAQKEIVSVDIDFNFILHPTRVNEKPVEVTEAPPAAPHAPLVGGPGHYSVNGDPVHSVDDDMEYMPY